MWPWRRTLRNVSLGAVLVALLSCSMPVGAGGGGGLTQASVGDMVAPAEAPCATGIVVTGDGAASAQPDLAVINLAVEAISPQVEEAIQENLERMTRVMAALEELALDKNDLQTVNYSVWVENVYDTEGRPTGETRYHAVNELRVRLHEPDRAGEVLGKVLRAGANRINGVSFGVADAAALQDQARAAAIADARKRAEQLATGLGASVGALRYVSEGYGSIPGPWMAAGIGGGGGESVPLSAGEFSVSIQVVAIFEVAR
ncbi:MAG: DUF541 domain-containing protein [Chloroflexi bacterium]|nr:DUF541 domain-containing protein [Chloroflexota bacterium]